MAADVATACGAVVALSACGTTVAVCFCPTTPLSNDPRAQFQRSFQTEMLTAPCKEPCWFCASIFCAPCAQYQLRTWALGGNMDEYMCCQGYFDCCCIKGGSMGDAGNPCCLLLESCICPGLAVQASRFYVMDRGNIMSSATDNQLMHFSNFLQLAACLCRLFDIDGAELCTLAADVFTTTLLGCMTAQTAHELRAEANGKAPPPPDWHAPQPMTMRRGPSVAPAVEYHQRPIAAPQPMVMAQPAMAQPSIPVAQYVQQPQAFLVTAPQGAAPGSVIQVQSPITGQAMQVQIPMGVPPGGTFQVMG